MAAAPWQAVSHAVEHGCQNWSGSLRFRPSRIEAPANEAELCALVREARHWGASLRPIGSGHSSSGIIATDGILVSLDGFAGLRSTERGQGRATLGAGTVLAEAGRLLHEAGLSMLNLGDVDTQTLAGALATGTHGSGTELANLSMMLVGGRLVTGRGEVVAFDLESRPELVRALRVSLGCLGILTEAVLQLAPAIVLRRQEWCTSHASVGPHLAALAAESRNFDYYWYPRSDEIKLRCLNPPESAPDYRDFARLAEDETGPLHAVVPKHSGLADRFDEMEYALPAEAMPDCFAAVRERVLARWRRHVGWRVLCRFISADDSWLSPAHGRPTATISLHQNASLPYRDYFADIEPILCAFGGRPHWAKIHTLEARDLRPLYPRWDDFLRLRADLDPDGIFLSPYLQRLLGVEGC